MKSSRLLSLVSAVFLLAGQVLLGAAQTPLGTANSQASALFQPGPVELPLAAQPAAPSALLAESVDCSRSLGALHTLYLPMLSKGGSTSALAAEAERLVTTQTFAPAANVGTDFATANAFLYLGSAAVQHGMQPQAIDPLRAATLRGRACTRAGTALAGVEITVLGHAEYGSTLSRADGMFDLAVNGGGLLTLNYARAGYLPVQRQILPPWLDYAWLPEVTLIPEDSQVTTIDLTSSDPMQAAQGSLVSDADGSRQAMVLFPQGTQAAVYNSDGTTRAVTSLNMRLTEYTVGDSGPAAMPGELPPASGYTYAVEISADEATVKIDGEDVILSQPAIFYVENFLDFNVGAPVPMGYYDNDRAVWVASNSGRVIQIISITAGMADLDTDGNGIADNDPALGITNAERTELAAQYAVSQSLWRVMIDHLSTWDANQNTDCVDGTCEPPPLAANPPPPVDKPCRMSGSIIDCQNQTLGEAIAISGTPFRLHYQSDRVPGYKAGYTLQIPLTGATLPPNIQKVYLEILIGGHLFTQSYPANPNQSATFTWDGRYANGNLVNGSQIATVRVGYSYKLEYVRTDRFGYYGNGIPISTNLARGEFNLWQEWRFPLGVRQNPPDNLEGWELNIHHTYDPVGKMLYLGDGGQRSAESLNFLVISTQAGSGASGYSGDGGSATNAKLNNPSGVAVGADGALYIADFTNNRVRKVDPNGIISTVAGVGTTCVTPTGCGDGGPATQAQLSPWGIAIGPDGSLYLTEPSHHKVRKVEPDGKISTIVGTGSPGYSGDGGLATQAKLQTPFGVALAPDGSLYIADTNNQRIRWVGTDGIITTVAGIGQPGGYSGDGGLATQAKLQNPQAVAIGVDGSLYIADTSNNRIRRVGFDGIITTIAGNGSACVPTQPCGDGSLATQAQLRNPRGVAVGFDSTLYIADSDTYRIRQVQAYGTISTIVGTGIPGYAGDSVPSSRALIKAPGGVAVGPDGSLLIVDTDNFRVRQVVSTLPQRKIGGTFIASEDGSEVYWFDYRGRHLQTLNAFTSAVLYDFAYDSANRLLSVTDRDGDITTITRDASGNPTAIVGPYGQATTLTPTANSYLASIANSVGETFQMSYAAGGLLTSFTNPRGHSSTFAYDGVGRLIRDDNAAGGFTALTRSETEQSYTVSLTTAMGRASTYKVANDDLGNQTRVNTPPSGLAGAASQGIDGTRTSQSPDGMTTDVLLGPDQRWGMLAPLASSATIATPGGVAATVAVTRTATLTDTHNPFSLSTLKETAVVNGRTYTSLYIAASQTFTDTSPKGRQSGTTIDEQGRPVFEQIAGLHPTNYGYDSHGRLTYATQGSGPAARTVALTYNSAGYLATITDPIGRMVSFLYDNAGRVTQQTLSDGRLIGYGYDANGNLTTVTPAGRPAHTFGYTDVDLMSSYTPPDVLPGTDQTVYAYNLDRQLTTITRSDGQVVSFGYDSAGRLHSVTIARGVVTYSYSPATGNLSAITAPGGLGLAYTYDGALLTGETWSGAVAGSTGYSYDNDFRITASTVNGGNSITYQYDQDSLLTQAGALTLNRDAQNGLLTGTTLGSLSDTWGYNGFAEPVDYSASYNASALYAVQYTRDNLGRITQKVETIGSVSITTVYSYDLAGRLTGVTQNGSTIATYTYDSNGNRLTFTGTGGTVTGSYDNQDRLLQYGPNTYAYTANGELLTKSNGGQATAYTYDALGNLMGVTLPNGTQIAYLVDGQNRRIGKQMNGTLVQGFLYDGQLRPVAELDGAGNIVSRFIYATHANVPDYMIKGGVTYRIVTDQLGSPRLVVSITTGAVAQQMDYDAFGNVTNDTNPGFQPFGFAGGLYDRDTKLVRFGARDYDAEVGQWTAKDPLLFEGGQTNLYEYAANDPINWQDPKGLECPDQEPPHDLPWWKPLTTVIPHLAEKLAHLLHMKVPGAAVPALEILDGVEQAAEGTAHALDYRKKNSNRRLFTDDPYGVGN